MLNLPIVDAHLHLWDPARLTYPWLDEIPAINRSFLLSDFDRLSAPVQVGKMVFVQCDCMPQQSADEVTWVTQLSAIEPRIAGIVAGASLEQGDAVRGELESLADNDLVKGVRRILQGESAEFCLQPSFIEGVQALANYNLSFDICINYRQMKAAIQLIEQCPQVQFVLDHIGKPDIKAQILDPWRDDMQQMATFPNVWCKLSGLATEADHSQWSTTDLQPFIEHTLDCFGFDRVMYGGDWPVSTLATTYPRWVNTLAQAVAGCSESEQQRLFVQTAETFYTLI